MKKITNFKNVHGFYKMFTDFKEVLGLKKNFLDLKNVHKSTWPAFPIPNLFCPYLFK